MIYLDNASTTKPSKKCLEIFNKYTEEFFNPSGIYMQSIKVKNDIESARETIKKALGVTSGNFIFTSSATEANNLAVFGSLKSTFKKFVFTMADHPSTYNIGVELKNKGYDVEFCPLGADGQIDYSAFEQILSKDTNFISVIHVSNETGAINDLKRISEIKNRICPNAILHADGVQAFGKIKINLDYFGVDLYTISGHKMNCVKGCAGLYYKNIVLKPQTFGGGQEFNLRSGTENVGAIMALKTAVEEIGNIQENCNYVNTLKQKFIDNIKDLPCSVNSQEKNSPYILSLTFRGVKGETLVHMMENNGVLISTGSACSSKKVGNRTLESMNVKDVVGSVRISFCKDNTLQEVDIASKTLAKCYNELIQKLR